LVWIHLTDLPARAANFPMPGRTFVGRRAFLRGLQRTPRGHHRFLRSWAERVAAATLYHGTPISFCTLFHTPPPPPRITYLLDSFSSSCLPWCLRRGFTRTHLHFSWLIPFAPRARPHTAQAPHLPPRTHAPPPPPHHFQERGCLPMDARLWRTAAALPPPAARCLCCATTRPPPPPHPHHHTPPPHHPAGRFPTGRWWDTGRDTGGALPSCLAPPHTHTAALALLPMTGCVARGGCGTTYAFSSHPPPIPVTAARTGCRKPRRCFPLPAHQNCQPALRPFRALLRPRLPQQRALL